MGKPLRPTSADVVYHVLNRANAQCCCFTKTGTIRRLSRYSRKRVSASPCDSWVYSLMPNHFHLAVWPYIKTTRDKNRPMTLDQVGKA